MLNTRTATNLVAPAHRGRTACRVEYGKRGDSFVALRLHASVGVCAATYTAYLGVEACRTSARLSVVVGLPRAARASRIAVEERAASEQSVLGLRVHNQLDDPADEICNGRGQSAHHQNLQARHPPRPARTHTPLPVRHRQASAVEPAPRDAWRRAGCCKSSAGAGPGVANAAVGRHASPAVVGRGGRDPANDVETRRTRRGASLRHAKRWRASLPGGETALHGAQREERDRGQANLSRAAPRGRHTHAHERHTHTSDRCGTTSVCVRARARKDWWAASRADWSANHKHTQWRAGSMSVEVRETPARSDRRGGLLAASASGGVRLEWGTGSDWRGVWMWAPPGSAGVPRLGWWRAWRALR
eukprot:6105700-Prymnesium_polylepis.1